MLIVKQDKSRDEQNEGQIFVELTMYRDIKNISDCNRLGYWCDKAHLSHFVRECAKVFTENELKEILKMNNETIEIKKENVMKAYKEARKNGYTPLVNTLESMFGKEIFTPKDVTERIKTFEDACEVLGNDNQAVADYYAVLDAVGSEDILAFVQLRIIAEALNEGWKPVFDGESCRYYPWFYVYSKKEYEELDDDEKAACRVVGRSSNSSSANGGLVGAYTYSASSHSYANHGSRLAFKTRELAEYCGKQFIDIWEKFLFA